MKTQLRVSNYPEPISMTRPELLEYLERIKKENTKFVAVKRNKKAPEQFKLKRVVIENKWKDHVEKPLVEFYNFHTGEGVTFDTLKDIPHEDIKVDNILIVRINEETNKEDE